MLSDIDIPLACCSPSDLSTPQLLSPSPSVALPDSPMERYSILEYHTGSIPGQGLLCPNVSTGHQQQQNPPMAGYAPYQPLSETNPWDMCLSQTQFPFQVANFPGVMGQPELAMDVKSDSMLSPMTLASPFRYDDKAAQQASLQSPPSPPDDANPSLIDCQVVAARNESPAPPGLAPPPRPKKPRRSRRTPKVRPLKKAPTPLSPPESPTSSRYQLSPSAERKALHSAIERKYRASMNGAMDRLRAAVIPPDSSSSPCSSDAPAAAGAASSAAASAASAGDDEPAGPHRPPSKAVVLHRAAEEIEALRASRDHVEGQVRALTADRDWWKRRAEALWRAEGRGADGDENV